MVEVDGVTVFVKRIPLTDIERQVANIGSTRDLFGLPSGCQYGVGSPGAGVWREIAANAMATELAIKGDLTCFAAMYGWRVLDGPASPTPLSDELADIESLVSYWHGAPGVRRRVEAISAATAHVAVFLEYFPTTLPRWLRGRVERGESVANAAIDRVEQCFVRDVPAMNDAGLFHFDTHLDNMLVDGETIVLADFGLATSPSFDLSAREHAFLTRNASHDVAHSITRFVDWLVTEFVNPKSVTERNEFVETTASTGRVWMPMHASARRVIERYSPVAAVINDFYWSLHTKDRAAEYPAKAVLQACAQAGLSVPDIG